MPAEKNNVVFSPTCLYSCVCVADAKQCNIARRKGRGGARAHKCAIEKAWKGKFRAHKML